jgi:NAD-dependent SIR2 family protein deacetylase
MLLNIIYSKGLLMRSGNCKEKLTELFGNVYTFQCDQCGVKKHRKSAKLGDKGIEPFFKIPSPLS